MSERTDLKVGFACNNRCVFCAQGDKRKQIGLIPGDELIARMRKAYRPGRGLVLTGGEPTIRKDLVDLVLAARRIGYAPIQVQTNGRMLAYVEAVRRLLAAGVTEFAPALHGPTAEVHDALTCAEGSFEQTVAGILNACASGAYVVTNTVVVASNLPFLADTIDLLASLGVKRAQLALVHPVGTATDDFNAVVPRISEAAEAITIAVRAGEHLGVEVVVEAVPPCFLPGLEHAIIEEHIPETTVVDLDGSPFDFSEWRRDDGKAKGPPCQRCSKADACEGPWREYPDQHGWDEFMPIGQS